MIVAPRAPVSSTGTFWKIPRRSARARSSLPCLRTAQPHAASTFQRAPPEVFGFGVITATPGRARSSQSRIPFGFPLRTRKTTVEVYGQLRCGSRSCQPFGRRPVAAIASMSQASARVTTSASRPSITARACLPEPPWDCWSSIVCPVFAVHSRAKVALSSW